MPQQIKRVGQWRVGDRVFYPQEWLEKISPQARPTPPYWTIIAFSKDMSAAHIRFNIYQTMQWVKVKKLSKYGSPD